MTSSQFPPLTGFSSFYAAALNKSDIINWEEGKQALPEMSLPVFSFVDRVLVSTIGLNNGFTQI